MSSREYFEVARWNFVGFKDLQFWGIGVFGLQKS